MGSHRKHNLRVKRRTVRRGHGLFSKLKDRAKLFFEGPKKGASNKLVREIDSNGAPIIKMWACRAPVETGVKKVLNWISGGRMQEKAKQLGYDNIWHAYLIVQLADGKLFRLEKNHVVEMKPASNADFMNPQEIPISQSGLTLKVLMDRASQGGLDSKLYTYSAQGNNCQNFVQDVVHRNQLAESPQVQKIVEPQDSEQLVGTLGPLKGITNLVTDLAGSAQRVINGDGLRRRKRNTKTAAFTRDFYRGVYVKRHKSKRI